MNYLVRRSPAVGSLLRIVPWRFSFFRFCKTVSFPFMEFKNEDDLLQEQQEEENKKRRVRKQANVELSYIYHRDRDGENMEPEEIPIYKMLAAYISQFDLTRILKFMNKLEEERSKGFALAMLRKSEPLLFNDVYYTILGPKVYWYLMIIYKRNGEKEDFRRMWNLAKDRKVYDTHLYLYAISFFRLHDDIDGAHEVLDEWYFGERPYSDRISRWHLHFEVKIKDILEFDYYRRLVREDTKSEVNDMLEDHQEEEERKKTAMEVRQNGWDPTKNLALSAYACVEYVEGRTDIESTVDVLRLLGKREPQDAIKPIMDIDQLSRKMAEAMRGGGFVGEVTTFEQE